MRQSTAFLGGIRMENDFGTHRPLEGKIKKVTLYSRKKRSTIFEQILELNDRKGNDTKSSITIRPAVGMSILFPNPVFWTGSWEYLKVRLRKLFLKNQVVTTGSSFRK